MNIYLKPVSRDRIKNNCFNYKHQLLRIITERHINSPIKIYVRWDHVTEARSKRPIKRNVRSLRKRYIEWGKSGKNSYVTAPWQAKAISPHFVKIHDGSSLCSQSSGIIVKLSFLLLTSPSSLINSAIARIPFREICIPWNRWCCPLRSFLKTEFLQRYISLVSLRWIIVKKE